VVRCAGVPSLWKSAAGNLYLGWRAVVVHPVQLALRGEPGASRFRANFFPEGLIPTTLEDRDRLREASRCVHCGLCDAPGTAAGLPSPSLLPLVFSRSTVELPQARAALARFGAASAPLAAGEALCPTGVPLRRLASWLAERLQRVDEARAARSEGS
jgi:hypothetical protein